VGKCAKGLVCDGLEVLAEISDDDPDFSEVDGLDRDVLRLVARHGVDVVLASIHDAARGAAEMRAEDEDALVSMRLNVFADRLRDAMRALR